MTMEFLTLNDAQTKTPHNIARMIMRTVIAQSELLQRLPWTLVEQFDYLEYEQIPAYAINWVKPGDAVKFCDTAPKSTISALCQCVNKAAGTPKNEYLIPAMIVDLVRDIERSALGNIIHETPFGLTNLLAASRREMVSRPVAGSDMDMLVSRLGLHWNPSECVFLMHSDLGMYLLSLKIISYDKGANKYTYRGASVIMADAYAFEGKIACVSLNPEHGLFGITKGQITNCPYMDTNDGVRSDYGPAMGWQIEVGIKEKANPNRPEEVAVADKDGMFEIVRVLWIGAFGLRNQNAGASIEGLTCA